MSSFSRPDNNSRSRVPFLDLRAAYLELSGEYDAAYKRVMESGRYILGAEVEAFETEFAAFCEARYCIGVGNGSEALFLILKAHEIGSGHEVLVPANTFIATWLSVTRTGATPVPVEPDPRTFNLDPDRVEAAVTPRTRAIVAVHLFGQPADMDALQLVTQKHGLHLIEDAAQAHGARWHGRPTGSLGRAAAFSFYPAKNLGAFGDGGAVVSDDADLIGRVRMLRNYGSAKKYQSSVPGFNSRLDPLQAAFLRVRLRRLDEWNQRRTAIAHAYLGRLANVAYLVLPTVVEAGQPSWHLFVVRHSRRDALRQYLEKIGVETEMHYPIPPHLSEAYAPLGLGRGSLPITENLADSVLSLPIGPQLSSAGVDRVVEGIKGFE